MKNQAKEEKSFPTYVDNTYDQDDVYYSTVINDSKKRRRIKKLLITAGLIATIGATFALETVEVEALKEVTINVEPSIVVGQNNENIYTYVVPEGYKLRFENDEPIGYKYEMGTYVLKDYLLNGISLKKTKY